jgi:hypothetical protein
VCALPVCMPYSYFIDLDAFLFWSERHAMKPQQNALKSAKVLK